MVFIRRRPAADPVVPATPAPGAALAALAVVPCETARARRRSNPWSGWAAREFAANQADRQLAAHRVWKPLPELGIRPKFTFSPAQPVFAMGSCFAREVEDALHGLGFEVPTRCDALFDEPLLKAPNAPAGQRPRAYLNRYNSMSLRDELRHLLGQDPALEEGALTYGLEGGATADLHYTQSLPQADRARTLERRRRVREHQGARLRACRVFVITLGMAECWHDREAGRYLNNTPGPRVMAAYGDRLEVHLTRFAQHLQALEEARALLAQAAGADLRIIVTVSPVPLEASFLEGDVVTTNLYSKSMLRAVAEEFAAAHADVDYFPSYEFVSVAAPDTAWAWDRRHVKPELVAHLMQAFRTHYVR